MPLASGSHPGPYEILSPLGEGGMGEVYRARDLRLGREVAIKVLPDRLASDADLVRRFEQARAVAALSHLNVLTLFDLGREGEGAFSLLEEAFAERSNGMAYLGVDPNLDGLRSDPRFADLVRQVGLERGNHT